MAQLIDTIIDQQAIEKQLTFLNSQLDASAKNLSECAVAAKGFSDQFANSKGIKDLISIMNQYQKTVQDTQKAQTDLANLEKTRATTQLQLQKAQESAAKAEQTAAQAALINQKAQTEVAKAEQIRSKTASDAQKAIDSKAKSDQKAAADAQKAANAEKLLSESEQKLISTLKNAGIQVDKLNVSKNEATKIATLTKTSNTALEGSFQKLSAEYNMNLMAYNKLSAAQRDSAAGKAMQANLSGMSTKLKEVSGSVGNFQMDVGNYKNSILNAMGANNGLIGNLSAMALGAEETGVTFKETATNGVKAFGKAMWDLMKNPIIATIAGIVAVFMLFKAAIDSNGEATEKLGQVMAPLKEILAVVMKVVSAFITVLLDGVLAFEKIGNAIMSLIPGLDAIAAKNKEAIEIEKQKQEIEERGRLMVVRNAKDELEYNEARMKSRQKDMYSAKERLAYNEKANDIEKANMEANLKLAEDTYANKKALMENEGKTYEQLSLKERKDLDDSEAAMYTAQADYYGKVQRLAMQHAQVVAEIQKDELDKETKEGEAKIEIWKSTMNSENMNALQKIAFDKELADKEIDLQIKLNNQKKENDLALAQIEIDIAIKHANEVYANDVALYNKEKALKDLNFDMQIAQAKASGDKLGAEALENQKKIYDNYLVEYAKNNKAIIDSQNKKRQDIIDAAKAEDAVLQAQKKEASNKAAHEYAAYHIELLTIQNQASLERRKADANYDQLSFSDKQKFDLQYILEEQNNEKIILAMKKHTGDLTLAQYNVEIEKMKTEMTNFNNQQKADLKKHNEDMLTANADYDTSQVKLNEDYANHDVAYQQEIAKKLFDINYRLQAQLAQMKLDASKKNDKDAQEAFNTTMANLNAQRAALEQSQKEGTQNNAADKLKTQLDNEVALKKNAASKLFTEGKINQQQYESQIQDIENQSQEKQLKNRIALDNAKLLQDDLAVKGKKMGADEVTKTIADANQAQADLDDIAAKKKEDLQAKEQANIEKGVEVTRKSVNAIQQIEGAQFERKMMQIENEKAASDKATQYEQMNIEAKAKSGILTAKEADAQAASLALQKANRDKQYAAEELKLKQQQAKFDRETAVFNIVIDTAQAIMKDAKLNIPLNFINIALDTALGVSELAVVLSKPIPQYAKGTEDHAGGLAVVGDNFKSELAITPEGMIYKTPNTPSIVNLPKHSKVLPDYDKVIQNLAFNASLRAMNDSTPMMNSYNDELMRGKMDDLIGQMTRQYNVLGQLDNLKTLNKVSGQLTVLNHIDKSLRSMKKNTWGS